MIHIERRMARGPCVDETECEMAKGYIVEELRVTGGSMRLRDSITGELVDVAITPGAAFTPPKPAGRRDTAASAASTSPPVEDLPASQKTAALSADESAARTVEKRKRKKRANKKPAAPRDAGGPEATPSASPTPVDASAIDTAPMTTPESREIIIDESKLSDEDKAALQSVRTILARSRHNKRGELGWKEVTVDGRSGVMARWGKGQFKILHAGEDAYALFYEWDGGKWQQIACGSAEDLMHIAARRAKEEVPMAPITTLTLEMARFFCGTPAQRAAAEKRLEPVFAERSIVPSQPLDLDLSRGSIVVKPRKPRKQADPVATTADAPIDPALDDKIGGSLKRVLEELE
ncbi:MAG: hypothetical protein JNL82_17495 [Myxococcales bacterium]|nr:hypothetical protein [Myxococcales bacterium]